MKRLTDFYHSLPIVRDNKGNRSTSHAYFNFEGKQYTIAIDSSSVQPLIALKAHLSEENFYRILCDNDLLIDNNPYGIEYYGYKPDLRPKRKITGVVMCTIFLFKILCLLSHLVRKCCM